MKNAISGNGKGEQGDLVVAHGQACPIGLCYEIAATPEQRLMAAVLLNGINYYVRYAEASKPGKRRLHDEAARWIGNRDATWPYSFENICNVLGIDSATLRRRLRSRRFGREKGVAPLSHPGAGVGRYAA